MINLTDMILVRTGFGKMLISKVIAKAVKEKLGRDTNICIGDLDATYADGKLNISIKDVRLEINGENIIDMLDL